MNTSTTIATTLYTTKWLRFVLEGMSASGKTAIWRVEAKDGGRLGVVHWYGPWRRYCFSPADQTIYEEQCLGDLATFCKTQTIAHKSRPPQDSPTERHE